MTREGFTRLSRPVRIPTHGHTYKKPKEPWAKLDRFVTLLFLLYARRLIRGRSLRKASILENLITAMS